MRYFGVSGFFLRIYRRVTRHMFFKGWAAMTHTTAPNGVAQDCSLSLLAINCHMKVWVCICRNLPGVLLLQHTKMIRICGLDCQTVTICNVLWTPPFYGIQSGQHLNHSKSVIWGTSTLARKSAEKIFRGMKLLHEFDVLGTIIYTSARKAYSFSASKLHKMVTDIRNIAVLPVPNKPKSILLASKVISQCSLAAGISRIPKKSSSKPQTEITNALWHRRPKWRARWLALAFLTVLNPHWQDPTLRWLT